MLLGTLGMLLLYVTFGGTVEVLALGSGVSLLIGLSVAAMLSTQRANRRQLQLLNELAIPLRLASERGFYERYRRFTQALSALADRLNHAEFLELILQDELAVRGPNG